MKIENINIDATIKEARRWLKEDKGLPAGFKAIVEILILLISILINRLNLNSSNSSTSPSSDPNRLRKKKKNMTGKKPGGQLGHKGTRLEKFKNPDKIKLIKVDKKILPPGEYKEVGYESRQVIDIIIKRKITEYRAQILQDKNGKKYIAPFPKGINSDIQYGDSIKTHAVYLSQFQLLPYNRIKDHFENQMKIPISAGTIFNFNEEAYDLLKDFEEIVKNKLISADLLHSDETGINVNGKRIWLHLASNNSWTYYYPHEKRGSEAMNQIGILPKFLGVLCHDHWKPYYNYNCLHSLCNAHHIRELERAFEQDGQKWASKLKSLLIEINEKVNNLDGILSKEESAKYRGKYKEIIIEAEIECPPPIPIKNKRGRVKRSKARNLLERLKNFENDTLRFMEDDKVPFTNNLGENDLRMTKVQQKISGCFRAIDGAYIFCLVRSYLSTCRKNELSATDALKLLFRKKLPDFINA